MGYFFHVAKIQANNLRVRIEFRKKYKFLLPDLGNRNELFYSCTGTIGNSNGCCLHCKIYPEVWTSF